MPPTSPSKKTLFATEQDRPEVARRRERWRAYQRRLDPHRLVFIDETWAKTNMTRLRGWAPCGQKLVAKVPQGRWRTLTFLAALRCDRIEAPCVLDGPIESVPYRLGHNPVALAFAGGRLVHVRPDQAWRVRG